MFERFISNHQRDRNGSAKSTWLRRHSDRIYRGCRELQLFRDEVGGASFGRGLYRAVSHRDHAAVMQRVADAFPEYSDRVFPLAFDWLNRIFCADFDRTVDAKPLLLILSHLTDEVVDLPVGVDEFHNMNLVEHHNGLLESDLFEAFLRSRQLTQLSRSECAGLSIPLFLGGQYAVENMEVTDIDVDWSITAKLLQQIRPLEEGAVINSVVIGGQAIS